MARRENQGMQIAMILFIITTLLFMLLTYVGYSSTTRLTGEKEELQSQVQSANTSARAAETLSTKLKEKIGLDAAMADPEVEAQVDAAVLKNSFSEENQTFLGIIDELNKRVTELSTSLAQANQDNQDLRQQMQQAIALEQQKLATARENEAKAQAGFNTAEREKQDYFASNQQLNARYVADANAARSELNKAKSDAEADVEQAQDKVRKIEIALDRAKEELLAHQMDTPDQYDGRVLGVVAATKTVLLNLGRADGLRPKMVFGVFDAEEPNVRSAQKKASIEVTRILGEHSAEARITQIDFTNPIVKNDFVSSPVWSPGQTLGVALVGKMDIDDDGLDDREYIRNLINLGGGRIDAEEIDKKVEGEVTVDTRYVVVGEGEASATGLLRQADDLGIERMSVSELLDLMGYAGRSRAVTYDGVLRPGDFVAEPRGITRGTPSAVEFRPRKPLRRRSTPQY